jgi:hypothetical protein
MIGCCVILTSTGNAFFVASEVVAHKLIKVIIMQVSVTQLVSLIRISRSQLNL